MLPDPDLQQNLQNAVTRLPLSADGIAAELGSRGITGEPACANACPLAVYFQQEIHADAIVSVSAGRVNASVGRRFASAATSDAMRDFVIGFDTSEYPGLMTQYDALEVTA